MLEHDKIFFRMISTYASLRCGCDSPVHNEERESRTDVGQLGRWGLRACMAFHKVEHVAPQCI